MNLKLVRGQRYEATGTHLDVAGAPVNISGWTIVLTVRLKLDSVGPAVLSKTCSVVSGAAGTYRVSLTSSETLVLPAHTYICDFWRTDAGYENPLGSGTLTVSKGALFQ